MVDVQVKYVIMRSFSGYSCLPEFSRRNHLNRLYHRWVTREVINSVHKLWQQINQAVVLGVSRSTHHSAFKFSLSVPSPCCSHFFRISLAIANGSHIAPVILALWLHFPTKHADGNQNHLFRSRCSAVLELCSTSPSLRQITLS